MASHDVEEQSGLALFVAEFTSAKVGIPGALCLIKDNDVFMRWRIARQVVAQEADQWLDRAFHLLSRNANASSLVTRVPGQCLPHDVDKRQVSGQECCPAIATEHGIQPAQCLAGT